MLGEEGGKGGKKGGLYVTPSSHTIYHLDHLSFSELPFPQLNMEITVEFFED